MAVLQVPDLRTRDLNGPASTTEFADAIIARLS
jgi:hypothetical protein